MKLRPLGHEKRSQMSLRRVHTHVFSRPAVASSFDFNKSNFEVLELTGIACHIESSGRRSARDASHRE